MDKNYKDIGIKIVKTLIPKICVCPICGMEQPFMKDREHWKKVKDLSLEKPTLLSVQRISAKCLNPVCRRKSFVLPIPGIEKYQRVALRVKDEALNKNILDNMPYYKTASSLSRLNTSGSKSSLDRWKQREAERYNFKDIIARIGFSGVLSIDEYKPKRAKHYDLMAADAIKWHILYLETIPLSPNRAGTIPRGGIEQFCCHLKELGINPWAVIFDLLAAYPKQVRKVWPKVIVQYDYFHVMQQIHKHLKNGLQFRRQLKGEELEPYRQELWENKWRILKNMDNWTAKDHKIISELIEFYRGTPVEAILIFKEQIHQIFNASNSKAEAYAKRDGLFKEKWWKDYWHLKKAMEFLMSSKFEYMITYMDDRRISRSGNIENLIAIWRQMEKVRRGFKTEKGKQNHLKLYQVKHYLETI
ncbi:MAG: transposase [Nitrospirota bacterium]